MKPPGTAAWAALAFLAGLLIVTQVRVNGHLGASLGDAYAAAAWSFGSGLVVLAAVLPLSRRARTRVGDVARAVRTGALRPWQAVGGFGGAFLVLSQALAASVTGTALFTIAVVAGQVGGGVVFDAVGLSPSGRRPLTRTRALGALLVLGAAATALVGRGDTAFSGWLLALPFAAGVCVSWQQGVNGRVRERSSGYAATFVNFLTGTAALLAALAVHAALAGPPASWPRSPWPAVLLEYSGGVIGIGFILIAALAVEHLGVLLLGLCTISGQLAGSVLLDVALPGPGVAAGTAAGAVIAVLGVAVGAAGARRSVTGRTRASRASSRG